MSLTNSFWYVRFSFFLKNEGESCAWPKGQPMPQPLLVCPLLMTSPPCSDHPATLYFGHTLGWEEYLIEEIFPLELQFWMTVCKNINNLAGILIRMIWTIWDMLFRTIIYPGMNSTIMLLVFHSFTLSLSCMLPLTFHLLLKLFWVCDELSQTLLVHTSPCVTSHGPSCCCSWGPHGIEPQSSQSDLECAHTKSMRPFQKMLHWKQVKRITAGSFQTDFGEHITCFTSSKVAYGLLLKGVKVLVDDLVWLVDRWCRSGVVVILPIEFCLTQAQVEALLLKVCVSLLALIGPFHHLGKRPCRWIISGLSVGGFASIWMEDLNRLQKVTIPWLTSNKNRKCEINNSL